jgi:nitrate/nitrite transporter NarK
MHAPATLRHPRRTTLAVVAFVVIASAGAGLGLRSSASAQAPGATTLIFTELDKGSTFKHIRNTKSKSRKANLLGDLDVFTNPLADASGKIVGRLHVGCFTTTGSSNFLKSKLMCSGIMVIPGGTLALQALTSPGDPTTNGAITGGTGDYANARGVFVSPEGKPDTITLVP